MKVKTGNTVLPLFKKPEPSTTVHPNDKDHKKSKTIEDAQCPIYELLGRSKSSND